MADEITDSSFRHRPAFTVKHNRSCFATACSVFQICLYAVLAAVTLFYLCFFGYTDGQLKKKASSSGRHCLLFGKGNSDDELGSSGPCSFFLGGSGVSVGLLLILILHSVFSALCGKWSACMKGFEVVILFLALLLSIATSLVLSIGYHYSCGKVEHGCGNYKVDGFNVNSRMSIVEPISWTVTGVIMVVFTVQLFSCICICCCNRQGVKYSKEQHMFDEKALLNNKTSGNVFT